MNKGILFRVIFFVMLAGILSLSCSPTGTSKVTININLGILDQHASSTSDNSIIDRFFRLFAKNAEAQTAPSNITSLTLNISGPDMDSQTRSFNAPVPSDISVDIPAGSSRTFEILAFTPSVTFRGEATADLEGGATVDLSITMALFETKILIPDYLNNRIVQINSNFNNTIWQTHSLWETFDRPSDIDFDSKGRIYIATAYNGILRINDITSDSYDLIRIEGGETSSNVLALDKSRNFLYYSLSYEISKCDLNSDLDPETGYSYETMIIQNENPGMQIARIYGIDIDDNGILYIVGESNNQNYPAVFKYDPRQNSENYEIVLATYPLFSSDLQFSDIIVKDNYVYVSIFDIYGSNHSVIQLDKNLEFAGESPLTLAGNPNEADAFYGPRRFVATLNKKFFIIDEFVDYENSPYNGDRVVSFDDINGTNWTTYGSTGEENGQFNFFEIGMTP